MTSLLAGAWRRAHGPVRDDSGFSLLEAVIALLVATVAFTALAAGAMSAIRGTMTGRMNQQAADFMGRQIERYRAIDFQAVANRASDMTGDAAVATCSGNPCFDPGNGVEERLYLRDGGGVFPHVETADTDEANKGTFTLSSYVTAPVWAQADYYRRLTVVVTWQDGNVTRTRMDSTIITNTQRGLPLPVFKMTPYGTSSVTVNPGATVVFGLTVTNQGAPDRFDLSEADPYTWAWYVDDGDGIYNPTSDTTAVADTDGNGTIDTGRLDPNASARIWLVRTVPATTTPGTQDTTVTATSRAQPAADGGVQTLPFSVQVVSGVITPTPTPSGSSPPPTAPPTDCSAASSATGSANAGYSLRSYTLHNKATPGNTDAQVGLVMAQTAPYATTLYEYSQNVMAGQPGRILLPGNSADAFPTGSLDPRKVADWSFPVGAKAYDGQAAVNVWVAPPSGSSLAQVNLAAYVYKYTKSGSSYVASPVTTINLVVSPFLCGGFQQVGGTGAISIPASGSGSLGKNDWVGLRIVNLGTANTRIAYDVQSLYPAAVALPES